MPRWAAVASCAPRMAESRESGRRSSLPTARTRTPRRRIRDGREDARHLRRRSLEVLRRQHPEGHGGDGQLGAPEEHVERVPPVAVEDDAEVPRHRWLARLPISFWMTRAG